MSPALTTDIMSRHLANNLSSGSFVLLLSSLFKLLRKVILLRGEYANLFFWGGELDHFDSKRLVFVNRIKSL